MTVPDLVGLGQNMWLYSMSNIAPQMLLGTQVYMSYLTFLT